MRFDSAPAKSACSLPRSVTKEAFWSTTDDRLPKDKGKSATLDLHQMPGPIINAKCVPNRMTTIPKDSNATGRPSSAATRQSSTRRPTASKSETRMSKSACGRNAVAGWMKRCGPWFAPGQIVDWVTCKGAHPTRCRADQYDLAFVLVGRNFSRLITSKNESSGMAGALETFVEIRQHHPLGIGGNTQIAYRNAFRQCLRECPGTHVEAFWPQPISAKDGYCLPSKSMAITSVARSAVRIRNLAQIANPRCNFTHLIYRAAAPLASPKTRFAFTRRHIGNQFLITKSGKRFSARLIAGVKDAGMNIGKMTLPAFWMLSAKRRSVFRACSASASQHLFQPWPRFAPQRARALQGTAPALPARIDDLRSRPGWFFAYTSMSLLMYCKPGSSCGSK